MSSNSLTYTSFVVAGAGGIGAPIAAALLQQGARVVVLTRGGNNKIPAGAVEKVVDYRDGSVLEQILRDADAEVVVSTLSGGGFAAQPALADAAKRAGVKLFVPSEFGSATHTITSPSLLDGKKQFVAHLKSLGLPYTVFYSGLFADMPLHLQLNSTPGVLDLNAKTLTIVGSADTRVSLVAYNDIGLYVAHTLTHLSAAQLEHAIFAIVAEKRTWREIAKVFEAKYGGTFEVVVRDADEVKKYVDDTGVPAFTDYIFWLIYKGYLDLEEWVRPDVFPDWKPLGYEEVVQKYYAL